MIKRTIQYTILLLLSLPLTAQESYQNIKKEVEKSIQAYTGNGKKNTSLNTIISNFNEGGKIDTNELKKNNVGICIVLSEDNPDLIISPAKYSFDDEKINISAIGPQNPGKLPEYMKEYVQKYLTEFETLGSTELFKKMMLKEIQTEGTLTENKTEAIVKEPNTISFIRGNDDWMYIISIDDEYKEVTNPRIIVYCFKKSISGKDIFNSNNSLDDAERRRVNRQTKLHEDRKNYPLYHDFRTDDLRTGLAQLLKYEPYKSNQELLNTAGKINEKLDRFTIRNYVDELNYLANLKISEAFLQEHFGHNYEAGNVTHLSVHSLGDIYFSQGKYQLAKEFYTKAIFTHQLIASSGTTISKDVDRIIYDLAKNAYKAGKKDEAYAFLMALMFNGSINTKEDINTYFKEQNEDKKQFKKDLDKALKTIKIGENYSYTFTFRRNKVFFIPIFVITLEILQQDFKNNEFYKSLE